MARLAHHAVAAIQYDRLDLRPAEVDAASCRHLRAILTRCAPGGEALSGPRRPEARRLPVCAGPELAAKDRAAPVREQRLGADPPPRVGATDPERDPEGRRRSGRDAPSVAEPHAREEPGV